MRNVIQGLLAAALLAGCGGAELDSAPGAEATQGEVHAMKDCEPCRTRLDNCMYAATTTEQEEACVRAWLSCTQAYCGRPTLQQ